MPLSPHVTTQAIRYSDGPTANAVTALNARLTAGSATLAFDPANGYLAAVLAALKVPVESQALVFSQTSFQGALINMHNPRAVFFNDTVAVGWVRGGDILEVSAFDPKQGVVFYALEQTKGAAPRFKRDNQCLACHLSWDTVGVPGHAAREHVSAAGRPECLRQRLSHRAGQSARAAVGWMVGDRRPRRGAAHGQRAGVAGGQQVQARQADADAEVGRGAVRPQGIPDTLQRRRGAAGAGASGADDEPDHADRLGGAARRRRRRRRTRRRAFARRPWISSTICSSSTKRR